MTLLQLTYFLSVSRNKNFTRAAAEMHVTQPTITNAVRDLEGEFGVKLIERTNKSFLITKEGKELFDMALHLLSHAEEIKLIMRDRAAEGNRLLFGCPLMTGAAEFANFFKLLHQEYPNIEVETTHALTKDLLAQLDDGKLQMVLVPYQPDQTKYRYMIWKHSKFLFCVPRNHRLACKKIISFADICYEPIISYFGDGYLTQFNLTQQYLANGATPQIVYRCSQIGVMKELIRRGEGCGFLIEGALDGVNGIVGIPLLEKLPVTFYLVWRKESERYSVIQKTLKVLRKHLKAE